LQKYSVSRDDKTDSIIIFCKKRQ